MKYEVFKLIGQPIVKLRTERMTHYGNFYNVVSRTSGLEYFWSKHELISKLLFTRYPRHHPIEIFPKVSVIVLVVSVLIHVVY